MSRAWSSFSIKQLPLFWVIYRNFSGLELGPSLQQTLFSHWLFTELHFYSSSSICHKLKIKSAVARCSRKHEEVQQIVNPQSTEDGKSAGVETALLSTNGEIKAERAVDKLGESPFYDPAPCILINISPRFSALSVLFSNAGRNFSLLV